MNENPTMNKLIGVAVTLTVAIIMIASLVVPVIHDAQRTAGEIVTYTNSESTLHYYYNVWEGEDVTISWNESNGLIVNDESVPFVFGPQRILIASNDFSSRSGGTESQPVMNSQYLLSDSQFASYPFVYEITGGEYTLTIGDNEYSGVVDWLVYVTPAGTLELTQAFDISAFYTSYESNIIVLGNIYTTGDEDSYYAYYNGELSVNPEYQDTAKVNITRNLVDGTTDVYMTGVTVTMDEETFTPYYILVDQVVTGHKISTSLSPLYGVIPIMLIVALLGVAVSTFRNKY